MGIVSIILGINLYALFVALFHRMFADKHGTGKAFVLSNLIIFSTLILGLLIYYW
ncbi:hypothetical protein KY306_00835 [Candidatus Woesearchaeota archaeon]|nr:hypothetical protein [Candidatus Woesearchaeota archaeon]